MAVATIDDDNLASVLSDGPWYWSEGVRLVRSGKPLDFTHGVISEVSLVRSTANIATRAVCWSRHDLATDAGGRPIGLPLMWHDTWRRAHERMSKHRYRNAPSRMTILDLDPVAPAPVAAKVRTGPRVILDGVQLDDVQSEVVLSLLEADRLDLIS
jgi:hypothetical protein